MKSMFTNQIASKRSEDQVAHSTEMIQQTDTTVQAYMSSRQQLSGHVSQSQAQTTNAPGHQPSAIAKTINSSDTHTNSYPTQRAETQKGSVLGQYSQEPVQVSATSASKASQR